MSALRTAASPGRLTSAQRVSSLADRVDYALGNVIETVWLVAIIWVPLVVLPDTAFLSFTELPKVASLRIIAGVGLIAWIGRFAISQLNAQSSASVNPPFRYQQWMVARSLGNPLVLISAVLLLVTAISAFASVAPAVSLLGAKTAGDSYDLLSLASYMSIFLLIATSVRTKGQIHRLWIAIGTTGILAGLVTLIQHFGMAPLGIASTANFIQSEGVRLTGTTGNPIYLGSLLTVTGPFAIAYTAYRAFQPGRSDGWWAATALAGFILFFALLLTGSRGPWIGFTIGVVVLLSLVCYSTDFKRFAMVAVALAISVVAVAGVSLIPTPSPSANLSDEEVQSLIARNLHVPGADRSALDGIDSALGRSTGSNRLEYWQSSSEIVASQPDVPGGANLPGPVRFLFGYGPDTFRYVLPLRVDGSHLWRLTTTAHNDFVNRAVEAGGVGLIIYIALLVLAFGIAIAILRHEKSESRSGAITFLTIAILTMLAGRVVEQMTGIARVSDTLIFWAGLGLLSAIYATMRLNNVPRAEAARQDQADRPNRRTEFAQPALLAVSFALIAGITALIWAQSIEPMRADSSARHALTIAADEPNSALSGLRNSMEVSPGRPEYGQLYATLLDARSDQVSDASTRVDLLFEAYEVRHQIATERPLDRDAKFQLAYSSWRLAELGSIEHAELTLQTYEDLLLLAPDHPVVIERLPKIRQAVASLSQQSVSNE